MTPSRLVPAILAAVAVAGCGANASTADLDLSERAAEGRSVANSNGCAACHGSEGEGGVGPAFVGLYGSTVELIDADPVTADDDYLRRAIEDPGFERVAGYRLPMPANDLGEDEIEAVIAYIRELADQDGES